MNWRQIFKRELRQMFVKDARRAIFLFGASIAYLVLFGMLYDAQVVKYVPLVVYDEDQTQLSRSLIQDFDDSERFQTVAYVSTQEEMEEYLHEKKAYAALHIPRKFAQYVKGGMSSQVLVIANGTNILITNTITTSAQEIVTAFSKNSGASLAETSGQMPFLSLNKAGPIDFELRVLNNPTLSYLYFFIIGLSMAAFQQGIFLSVGASMISEYKNVRELENSPSIHIMLGKLLPYWLSSTLAFLLTVYISISVFDIPCKGDWISLILIAITFTFTAISLCSFIASNCTNEVTFTKISLIYTVPAYILSGHNWPHHAMDAFSQAFSYTFPLFYFADTVREIMIGGYSPFLYRNIVVLLLTGIVLISLSTILYTRKRKRILCSQDSLAG